MNLVRFLRLVMALSTVFTLAACSGSGSGTPAAGNAKATIAGSVEFPPVVPAKQTAKHVDAVVTNVIIKVYSVDTGQEVTGVTVTVNDSATNTNTYTYTTSGLTPNVNYVFKALRGNQVVRRYIPSTLVTSGAAVTGQTVDAVSTATVILVQTKLNLASGTILGETALPSGVSSAAINNLQPTFLETSIRNDIANGTASANVTLVTSITAAVAASTDPVKSPTAAITQQASTAATSYTAPATTADAAVQYVAQAKTALARQDVATASTAFEAALAADPANKDANFGGALTKIVMMIDDPKVKDIVAKWGVISPSANQVLSHASPVGNPFTNWTSAFQKLPSTGLAKTAAKSASGEQNAAKAVASSFNLLRDSLPKFTPRGAIAKTTAKTAASTVIPATAPTVSDMQVLIAGTIIPSLQTALARLQKVEGTSYSFVMTKAMQGNPVSGVDITLNDGEIYALDTAINAFLCVLNVGVSYDLDVYDYDGNGTRNDYDKVSQDPLKTINQSTFFTLKSTGAASMTAGLTALQGAITSLDKAYTAVKSRTAAQTAAGQGAFDLTNMTAQDRADFEKFLGYAKQAVAGQTTISYNNGTTTIAVDITKFFTKPLTRANAPALGYDVQPDAALSAKYNKPVAGEQTFGTAPYTWTNPIESKIVPTADIPDYTLNGMLPNNTIANNVAGFNGILPVLSGKLLTGSYDDLYTYNLTTDGASIYYQTYVGSSLAINKIDPTTGAVSVYATDSTGGQYLQYLIWYNGGLYNMATQYDSTTIPSTSVMVLSPVTVVNGTFTIGTAVKTISLASNQWPSTVTSNGTDIYYALQTWNPLTNTATTEIRKMSNLTTDVSLFTVPDSVSTLNVSSNYLYAGKEKRNLTSPYSVVATYGNFGNANSDILIGGYFYVIDNGKIIKKAGTPSGGTAKPALF